MYFIRKFFWGTVCVLFGLFLIAVGIFVACLMYDKVHEYAVVTFTDKALQTGLSILFILIWWHGAKLALRLFLHLVENTLNKS